MPRPIEFNREQALAKAILLFRKQGFAATSMEELSLTMEIGRSSLYNSFGDKRQLYLEALETHLGSTVSIQLSRLSSSTSPIAALLASLELPDWDDDDSRKLGCFGAGALSEFGTADDDVLRVTRWASQEIREGLSIRIEEGQEVGEIDSALSPIDAAAYIQAVMTGLQLEARDGAELSELRNMAAFAVSRLAKAA